jgi:hypothetical protein
VGEETLHREGKQHWGLGEYQRRKVVQQFVNTVIQRAHEGEEAVARLQQQLTAFFQRFDVLSTARKLAVT